MTDLGLAACLLSSLPFALRCGGPGCPPAPTCWCSPSPSAWRSAPNTRVWRSPCPSPRSAPSRCVRRRRSTRAPPPARVRAGGPAGDWRLLVRPEPSGHRQSVLSGRPPGTAAPALYGGAEMRAWEYHLPVARSRRARLRCCSGRASASSAPRRSPSRASGAALEAALALVLLATFWFVIPYQESRFLFAAFGVAAIAIARAADRPPAAGRLVRARHRDRRLAAAVADARAPAAPAVVGAAAALVCTLWRRLAIRVGRIGASVDGVTVAVGLIALLVGLVAGDERYGRRVPPYTVGDDDLAAAWAWFRANVADDHVAYTGNNLAFPLAGQHLANRVAYVNVAGAPGDRLHDFGPPGDGTAEPAPYRRGANPEAWLANLRADGHTTSCSSRALDPIVRRTIAADADGFPVERAWADARPDVFPPALRVGRGARLRGGAAVSRAVARRVRRGAAAVRRRPLPGPDGRDRSVLQPAPRRDRAARPRRAADKLCCRSRIPTPATSTWPGCSRSSWRSRTGRAASPARCCSRPPSCSRRSRCCSGWRSGAARIPPAAALALALSAWAAEPRFVERPHLVTFLGLALHAARARARRVRPAARALRPRALRPGVGERELLLLPGAAGAGAVRARRAPRRASGRCAPRRRCAPLALVPADPRDAVGRARARLHRQPLAHALAAAAGGVRPRALARRRPRRVRRRRRHRWRPSSPRRRWRHLLPVVAARPRRRAPQPVRRRVRAAVRADRRARADRRRRGRDRRV